MRNNLYEVSRGVYGKEMTNMQPIAFGYVPANRRGEDRESIESSGAHGDEHRSNRGIMADRNLANRNS